MTSGISERLAHGSFGGAVLLDETGKIIEVRRKNAKTFFVNVKNEVLVLCRSDEEDTRQGEADLPGGKPESGENPQAAAVREARGELPGIEIVHIEHIYTHPSIKEDVKWLSDFYVGLAEFPPGDIKTSNEHVGATWVRRDMLSMLKWPAKYPNAAVIGAPVLDRLVEICRTDAEEFLAQPRYLQAI